MLLFKTIPFGLILLIADASPASARLLPRTIQRIHTAAVRHTRSLANDLRVAFGGVLVSQPSTSNTQHVIYCKPGRPVGSPIVNKGPTSSQSSGTSSRVAPSGTMSSTVPSSSSQTTPSSPWKLAESHVGLNSISEDIPTYRRFSARK